jgi:cytosine/uracil/thiamine/allantoin permease
VPGELQRTDRGSIYWRNGGFHWPAIIAQAAGIAASVLAFDQEFYVGPIANIFGNGGADFSVFTGVVVGGIVYFLLAGGTVRREADVQEELLAR